MAFTVILLFLVYSIPQFAAFCGQILVLTIAASILIVTYYLYFFNDFPREVPYNYLSLLAYTSAFSFIITWVAANIDINLIITCMVVIMTATFILFLASFLSIKKGNFYYIMMFATAVQAYIAQKIIRMMIRSLDYENGIDIVSYGICGSILYCTYMLVYIYHMVYKADIDDYIHCAFKLYSGYASFAVYILSLFSC